MKTTNAWAIAMKESENIVKAIEAGQIKTQSEISKYIYNLYSYRVASAIESIVNAYISCESLDIPYSIDEQS